MNLKLLALAICLLIGGACAKDNQDYDNLYTILTGVDSNLNSTELSLVPRLDVPLQKLIDDAQDGSSVRIPLDSYKLSEPLHINKNIIIIGSPFAVLDAQGTSQILNIDNPEVSVTLKNLLLSSGNGDYGGAINSNAKLLTIKDCRFSDSLANYGASIYQKGGNLRIEDSSFERNNATVWGAAIYNNGGDMQVESSTFTQNPGSYVICFNGTQPKQAKVSIKDCNVSDNPGPYSIESVGFGGAIVCRNSTTLIDHCIIKGNRALLVTPTLISGCNAGLDFGSSDVMLNDTLIEGNEALYAPAIFVGQNSTVAINRCTIAGNRALRVLNNGRHIDGDIAGISIGTGSKVTMNDVSLRNNLAEGECAAISNSGILSLKNVRIYENTAGNYSAIRNSRDGKVTLGKNVQIFDNNAIEDVHSEGTMEMDFS